MAAPTKSRRRFHFSLRTLFSVVTIVGGLLGWLGMQLKWIHDRHEAREWIADYRARQLAAESGGLIPPLKGEYVSHAGTKAPWSLRIFGERGIERLEVYQDWVNSDARYNLNELRLLFPEAAVKASASRRDRAGTNASQEWIIGAEAMDQPAATK